MTAFILVTKSKVGFNMIICEKMNCVGCALCKNKCPQNAISMQSDKKGFMYPTIDVTKCNKCGICSKICPANEKGENKEPKAVFGVVSKDADLLSVSSSGGAFGIFANYVLENDGYVCGAAFNNNFFSVKHYLIDNKCELESIQKSKYVQSDIDECYQQILELLEADRQVLFCGCPCQVAAIKKYIGKDYDNLLCIDLLCHGAASPKAWSKYLHEISDGKQISKLNFRDDSLDIGCCVSIEYKDGSVFKENGRENTYINSYLNNLIIRPSCEMCKYTHTERQGDITIGDFWGWERYWAEISPQKGVSLVLINTEKGIRAWEKVRSDNMIIKQFDYSDIKYLNTGLFRGKICNPGTDMFYSMIDGYSYDECFRRSLEKKYDIAISGQWFSWNYGATLTSFALYKVIESLGYSAILLDAPPTYRKKSVYTFLISALNREFLRKHCVLGPIYNSVTENILLNQLADTFVCGSDQLWANWDNVYMHISGYRIFDFVDDNKKKIAYATSFGTGEFKGNYTDKKFFQLLLNRFDAISVREDEGVAICEEMNINAVQMPDPVFLYDPKEYKDMAQQPDEAIQPYVLAYILHPTKYKQELLKKIEKALNLKLIILGDSDPDRRLEYGYPQWNMEIHAPTSIEKWLGYFKYAKYVITDSFHGFCFSLIFNKQFLCLEPRDTISRFKSLARKLKVEERILFIGTVDEAIDKINERIDYESISGCLESEKNRGIEWLRNELGKSKQYCNTSCDELVKYKSNADLYITRNELLSRIERLSQATLRNQKLLISNFLLTKFKGKRIVIKGAGAHTRELLKIMPSEVDIIAILDKHESRISLDGIPVYRDDMILKLKYDFVLISSYRYADEMKRDLSAICRADRIFDMYHELAKVGAIFDREFYHGE